MRLYKAPLWSLIILFGCYCQLWAAEKPAKAAIASAHPLATQAGHEILRKGGNAFDAAVAVTAVLAVVEPYSSGLGGGGFWLLHRSSDGFQTMLDGRERAPLAAHRDLYLDEQGEVVAQKSIDGALAAGIPGVPAALAHLTENYGKLPLAELLKPAIEIAEKGFAVDDYYRRMASWRLPVLQAHDASAVQFLLQGEVPPVGHLIKQPDLAATLKRLAERGVDGFYRGELAQRLVDGVRSAGGIWTLQDLRDYRVVERRPITGHYQGMRITSAAPPSSGGIAILTILNILQENNYAELSEPQKTHLLVEAMRRAYRDRAEYLGDPDYVQVPVEKLTHPLYGAGLARSIDMQRATPSPKQAERSTAEGQDTTHFSILDREGNRVAATLSINYPFGAGVVVPGTGVLLNDEMDDFSASPGVPNVYGLVGGEANAIEGGKRMLSSMTPTFVEDAHRIAILGTPGGSRIITMVLLGILEMANGRGPEAWVKLPRFHHQYLPDVIQIESDALNDQLISQLTEMGHNFKPLKNRYGNMQAVVWHKSTGQVEAASDPRGVGMAKIE
ncbi:MAG: gamma-glutamyltransferase [Candidatus Thiodiazotropha lotti]|uniref:Glutathione hydrolase proenzyme n=1 Tax=Candidatus Thiodiazotropha endoloripes TaxID=1818881 RepID=A0A1E2UUS2_9GAMM|nr:gamma-glutamyltransferase [Candidatus Thiodiazotropha endoloripes]MCG7897800.1 gamma-glutamyltransferase [Candidatus Thiodiazotropha weberae]MCG7993530.1 gamma-glutamyltransferase [Candidatus Thiodiazotropha lotti]MCG7901209.1 gamma-glutamyltransferase [Candidatus Thiodiazotropha weberae]MCG7997951.1 gamma-glutamyltransferase [Candidatus Thiodiazotropha lotti]MCW4185194.1 gamma-glutamyltransferase [Candidatus Thiodiazotropha weberae]